MEIAEVVNNGDVVALFEQLQPGVRVDVSQTTNYSDAVFRALMIVAEHHEINQEEAAFKSEQLLGGAGGLDDVKEDGD
ncbi:hypothetical protein PgNI_06540 [Pyricularia grisea]|uniref:Uncharacterized protein n=1 Tax=Pyricularia grisea TaxID=148305 RepID=A0A6P8B5S8_PYRGI|nr:hypothetical protein PgNI_06540 [Pyricularia grisea]TLD10696.1 hypothetical protein PgNI_06540 [Pyricularia grisea]